MTFIEAAHPLVRLWSLFHLEGKKSHLGCILSSFMSTGSRSQSGQPSFLKPFSAFYLCPQASPKAPPPTCHPIPKVFLQFSSVQSLSHVRLFTTPWTAACQASLSITNSQSLLKLMSIKSGMPSNHLILFFSISFSVIPFCLQSFSASGSFPRSQFFTSGSLSFGVSVSASFLPMNIQG